MNAIEIQAMPPVEQARSDGSPDIPPMAAAVALGIAFVITLGGLAFSEFGWVPGALGSPVVAVLAWQMSRELVAADRVHAVSVSLWFAARTILVTAAPVVAVITAWTLVAGLAWVVDGHPAVEIPLYIFMGAVLLVALAVIYFLFGLAFVGLPMLALVIPAAIVWAILVRTIAGRMARGTGAPEPGPSWLGAAPR